MQKISRALLSGFASNSFAVLLLGLFGLSLIAPPSGDAQDCLHCPGRALNIDQSDGIGSQNGGGEAISNQSNAELTIEFWFRPRNVGASDAEVLWEQGTGDEGISVYLYQGELYASIKSPASGFNDHWLSTAAVENGTWHHVAFVLDANTDQTTLYLDGEAVGTDVPGMALPAHGAGNGLGGSNGAAPLHDNGLSTAKYDGWIDQFRAWRAVLSEREVKSRRHRSLWNDEFDPADDAVTVEEDTLDLHWPVNLSDAESNPGWGYVGVSNRGIAGGIFDLPENGGSLDSSDVPMTTNLLAAGSNSETVNARGPDGNTVEATAAGDTLLVSYFGSSSGAPVDLGSGAPTEARINLAWVIDPKNEQESSPDLTFDYSSVEGIDETSDLVVLKRNGPEASWSQASGWTHDEGNRTFTKDGESVAGYAEYSVGGTFDQDPDQLQKVTYDLEAQSNGGAIPNGVDATATFWEYTDSQTVVTLELDGGATDTDVAHPAHIHNNSASEGGSIEIYLTPIDGSGGGGTSARVVNQPFDSLRTFDGYINIHESVANLGNVVSQGNIGANADSTAEPGLDPVDDPRSTQYDLAANPNDGAFPDGVPGEATFQELTSGLTLVSLTLTVDGATGADVSHPAHIHNNSVEEGGGIEYYLSPVDGSDSESRSSKLVAESFDVLTGFDGHINVHESVANLGNVVSQGDIGANAGFPTASDDSYSTPTGQTLTVGAPGVLENDSDPDGDSLSAALVSDVSNGSLTLDANGAFEYVPDSSFSGTDSFAYAASDPAGLSDTASVQVQVTQGDVTRVISVAAGWNLLSVPLETSDPSFGAVLPLCESGFFFETGSGYNGIAEGDPVPVGRGLFANCSAGTAEVTGQAPAPTIEVAEGWNIIGPLADSIDVGSITSDPAGIVQSSFFGFDPASGYQGVSTLSPGAGYWVKVGESGTLDLSGNSGGASALASTQSASTAQKQPGTELRLTDAAGREATLRLTENLTEAQRKRSALPPVPPSGVFDVRFESGRSVAEATGDVRDIDTQGLEAPVTVRLANAEAGQGVRIRHDGSETRLTAERPSAEFTSTEDLAVGLQAAPEAFALEKTYPNPASGRATVEYALPEQAEVTIAVYDVLGRRVATLADGDEQAGRHAAVLDTGQMPSGTYFVRMQAEGFRQTRRLTVVR